MPPLKIGVLKQWIMESAYYQRSITGHLIYLSSIIILIGCYLRESIVLLMLGVTEG